MIQRTACLLARCDDPYHNLAVEKHLMDTLPESTAILYLWQNQRVISFGRNQNPWRECRVDDFLRSGGRLVRRLSGGGLMYHDLGVLNFSFILPKSDLDVRKQLSVVLMAVGAFGIRAELSGRNNLQSAGCKFNENAFYKAGHSAYHHGTLLWNVDMDDMERYLAPSDEETFSQGTGPERVRMINLRNVCKDMTLAGIRESLYNAFTYVYGFEPIMLDESMLDSYTIARLTEGLKSEDWLYPATHPYTFAVEERFPWGTVTVKLLQEGGFIRQAKIFTDAMEAGLFIRLEQALNGAPYLISAVNSRFTQKMEMLMDHTLLQMSQDVCALICGKMRAMDRANGQSVKDTEKGLPNEI